MNEGSRLNKEREKRGSPWAGLVSLAMICATVVLVVYIVWGQ